MRENLEQLRRENMRRHGFGNEFMKRLKICENCGTASGLMRQYCPDCGKRLPRHSLYDQYRKRHNACPQCETILAENTAFCPQCGIAIVSQQQDQTGGIK